MIQYVLITMPLMKFLVAPDFPIDQKITAMYRPIAGRTLYWQPALETHILPLLIS